ncbi:hypothetical protein, partial [Nocardia farcinica]|uniref:hypothetical protein n=1 Tax=Nocardia farcinica TaxID=37329 RepID=UPI0024541E4E
MRYSEGLIRRLQAVGGGGGGGERPAPRGPQRGDRRRARGGALVDDREVVAVGLAGEQLGVGVHLHALGRLQGGGVTVG